MLPMSDNKKCQLILFMRLAGYREHTYECLVLLFRRLARNYQGLTANFSIKFHFEGGMKFHQKSRENTRKCQFSVKLQFSRRKFSL